MSLAESGTAVSGSGEGLSGTRAHRGTAIRFPHAGQCARVPANRLDDRRYGRTALSEPEARAIEQLIVQYVPDRIVSIHQPLACIDYDGPGSALAARMAQFCDLPVKKLGARPGSLGSYAGVTLGIPIITFEMLRADSQLTSETLWQRYGKALLAAIVYPDSVE